MSRDLIKQGREWQSDAAKPQNSKCAERKMRIRKRELMTNISVDEPWDESDMKKDGEAIPYVALLTTVIADGSLCI